MRLRWLRRLIERIRRGPIWYIERVFDIMAIPATPLPITRELVEITCNTCYT
jgi:hypothetical protein